MKAYLHCAEHAAVFPQRTCTEAMLPFCNMPLIAHILSFLEQQDFDAAVLLDADARTRAFVTELTGRQTSCRMDVQFAASAGLSPADMPALVLRRLCLPLWDMGELRSLGEADSVTLLQRDGTPAFAELHRIGSPLTPPAKTAAVSLSRFPQVQDAADYLALQRQLLARPAMERFRLGEGLSVGKDCQIGTDCVLGSDCILGDHVVLEDCCLGDGVQIGANVRLKGCVIGSGALIDRDVRLEGGIVPPGHVQTADSAAFRCTCTLHAEDGFCRGLPRWNNAPTALQAGAAMTVLGKQLAIGCNTPAARGLALAAAAGAVSQGGTVWDAGICTLSQLVYVGETAGCEGLLWVEGDSVLRLEPRTAGGFPLTAAQRRRLERGLDGGISGRIGQQGRLEDAAPLLTLWARDCRRLLPAMPFDIAVSCGNAVMRQAAEGILPQGTGERIVCILSEDGTQVRAYTDAGGMVQWEQLLLLSLLALRERREALALPADFHPTAEDFAAKYGGRILRLHSRELTPAAAALYRKQALCTDGVRLFLHVLQVLAHRRLSLAQAVRLLPPMYTARRYFPLTSLGRSAERLRRASTDPAVQLELSGNALRMLVHADSMETASELCSFWEQSLQRQMGTDEAEHS